MKFQIRKSKWRQRFWVTIVASNGKTLFHSENYRDKRDAMNAIDLILLAIGEQAVQIEDLT